MKKMRHKQTITEGFTLIELMIVIAIIGILAAVSIPMYQKYIVRMKVSEGFDMIGPIKASVWDYFVTVGQLPTSNTMAGLGSPTSYAGEYVKSVAVGSNPVAGTLTVTYSTVKLPSLTMVFEPTDNGGSVSWRCRSGTVPAKYLPSSCQ